MALESKDFFNHRTPESEPRGEEKDYKPVVPPTDKIVRAPNEIIPNPVPGRKLDPSVINFKYYNRFNYSLLPKQNEDLRLAFGITSATPGEGKSLVASNLAVSLTVGYRKKTILVDLNIQRPTLHETFGTVLSPGLVEALHEGTIHVSQTKIPYLSVLSAGAGRGRQYGVDSSTKRGERRPPPQTVGLAQMAAFGDVIYSLQQEYEFVIVDMPAINTGDFPILFASRLSGLLVVVDTTRTKKAEIDKMFRHLNENQVLGFVLNRVTDEEE